MKIRELQFNRTGYGDHERASIMNNKVHVLFTVGKDNDGEIFLLITGDIEFKQDCLSSFEKAKEIANKKCSEFVNNLHDEILKLGR